METERITPSDISRMLKFERVIEALRDQGESTAPDQIELLRVQAFKGREYARREAEERLSIEEGIL